MENERGEIRKLDSLLPLIYSELRRLAAYHLRRERRNHTLEPTELVNEVFLLLREQHSLDFDDRKYVLALASTMMRRILANYAKARNRQKRGGGNNVSIEDVGPLTLAGFDHDIVDILALEKLLKELELRDHRQVRIVEMHFFAGLTFEEIASVLEVSQRTIMRSWRYTRAWLLDRLK